MLTRSNLLGLVIAAIFTFTGLLIENGNAFFQIGQFLTFIFGLIMILAQSTIVGTIYWKIIFITFLLSNVASPILLFGSIMMDVPLVGTVYLGFLAIYLGTYLVWFFKKPKIGYLDILKLVWVLCAFALPYFVLFMESKWFLYASDLVLWIIILNYLAIGLKNKNLIISKSAKA